MESVTRYCVNPVCQRPITGCFGFVIARDVLRPLPFNRWPRELCGKCVFRLEENLPALERILASV